MAIASKETKNISSLDTEIGNLEFLVPDMVSAELKRISQGTSKKKVRH